MKRFVILTGALFERGGAHVTPDAVYDLRRLAASLVAHPERRATIEGLSNGSGDRYLDRGLSGERASVSGATTRVVMSDNALESNLGYGIHADGSGARVSASANSVQHAVFGGGMACTGGGLLITIGNNDVDGYAENPTGCLTKSAGI